MTSLTYREQLLHPKWQQRRLSMLEAAGWECANCGASENTLHVHHRQYFKGRAVWEYDDTELVVLCDPCHSNEHVDLDLLKKLLAQMPAGQVAALLGGFHKGDDWIDPGLVAACRQTDNLVFAAGFVAYITHGLDIDQMLKVARFAASLHTPASEYRLQFECSRGNTFGEPTE